MKAGAIPAKYKELMVAVTLTTQCPYCIAIHTKRAREAGVTAAELAETTFVAAALRAGGVVTHGPIRSSKRCSGQWLRDPHDSRPLA
ncbi:MAG TPA: carboxymuconolactone decarboxylase family protein [Phycisphaerae bacterium]|jgi:AhpD family alkylhydroperoxidase|nr:carboxymuconolactone decarboxylase family protein [Phycisphaerae bacterium]